MIDFDRLPSRLVMGAAHQDAHRKAAVDLLIGHGFWLRHPDFTAACIGYGEGSAAYIQWEAARAFAFGNPGASTTQVAFLDLAVSLATDRYKLSRMDDARADMIVRAFAQALGVEADHG